jgi:BASS family bile acid:Na+ symporter
MPSGMGLVFELLVAVTVLATTTLIGIGTTSDAIRRAARRRWVLASTVALNVVIIPVAAFLFVNALGLPEGHSTGVLLCAMCAAGPLGLKAAQIARGDLAWAVSVTVILTLLNVGTLPLWSGLLLPLSVAPPPAQTLGVLVVLILLPVVVGSTMRHRSPGRAVRLMPRLEVFSNVTLALAVAVGLATYSEELWSTATSQTPLVVVVLLAVGLVAGLLIPGSPGEVRRVSALVTMNRSTGVALLIVSRAFAGHGGVFSAVITYAVLQTAAALTVALIWRRRSMVAACSA